VTLVTTQNCTKVLKNVTFVVQITYFCFRPNKRREKQKKKFLLFLATFERLSLQKVTSTFFGVTFEQLLSKYLRNAGQLFGKSRPTCGKP